MDRLVALADQGIVSATALLTTIIVGRACPKEELGIFAAGLSVIVLAYSAQKALILTPYLVLNPRMNGEDHRLYKGSSIIHQLGFSTLLSVVICVSAVVVVHSPTKEVFGHLLFVLAVMAPFIVFREYARQNSFAELKFRNALILDICVSLAQLAAMLVLALEGRLSAALAFVVIGTACSLATLGWLASDWRHFTIVAGNALSDLSRNWFYARWLFGSGLLRELSVSLYPWIIIALHGASTAGMWAAAVGVVALYNPVMLALYNEAAPRISHSFAEGGIGALRAAISDTSKRCSLAAVPVFLALLFFGDRLVTLVYGPKYAGVGPTVAILAASAVVMAFGYPFPYGLLAIERPKLDFLGNAAAFLVLIMVGFWAARSFGTVGAAAGVLTAHTIAVVVKATGFRLAASGHTL